MTNTIEEFFQAALAAPPAVREQAMLILEGKALIQDSRAIALTDEPYLTLKAVSARIGVSTTTLWRYGIPGHEFGGRPRYRLSEVQEYLRSPEFQRRAAALRAERNGGGR